MILAQRGYAKSSSSVILSEAPVENPLPGELVLLDFDQSNLRGEYHMARAVIAFVCGMNFQMGCQDRLRVNDEKALA